VLAGIGMGLFFAPVARLVLGFVPPALEGAASGTTNALRQLGTVLGVAVLSAVFSATGGGRPRPAVAGRPGPAPAGGGAGARAAAVAGLLIPAPRPVPARSGQSGTPGLAAQPAPQATPAGEPVPALAGV